MTAHCTSMNETKNDMYTNLGETVWVRNAAKPHMMPPIKCSKAGIVSLPPRTQADGGTRMSRRLFGICKLDALRGSSPLLYIKRPSLEYEIHHRSRE